MAAMPTPKKELGPDSCGLSFGSCSSISVGLLRTGIAAAGEREAVYDSDSQSQANDNQMMTN